MEREKYGYGKAINALPNDDCDAAIAIGDGTYSGETYTATNDGSASCGSSSASPDVWYEYVSAEDGIIIANTFGSNYDTMLSVHTNCPGTSNNQIACNDDCSGLQSCVSFTAKTGNSYIIRVSGFDGDSGNFI